MRGAAGFFISKDFCECCERDLDPSLNSSYLSAQNSCCSTHRSFWEGVMSEEKEILVELNLRVPANIERGYGINSTFGPNGCMMILRSTVVEREKVHKAAKLLGISASTFIRCLMNDAADTVIEYYERKELNKE